MPPTVLLIHPGQVSWTGLRMILEEQRDVHLVGQVRYVDEAIAAVKELQPNLIFTAPMLDGIPVVTLVKQMHACSHASKILLLGESLEGDELRELLREGVVGYLPWEALSPVSIPQVLATVQAGLLVASRIALEHMLMEIGPKSHLDEAHVKLSVQEQAVLHGMAIGLRACSRIFKTPQAAA